MDDYALVNSPEFLDAVNPSGPGGRKLHTIRVPGLIKRRWRNPHPRVPDGSVVLLDDARRMEATWHPLSAWDEADDARHFGWFHFVAPINGELRTWPIEKLRYPHEADGTGQAGQLSTEDWEYENDGSPYPDVWAVIFDGKLDSPVRNRRQKRPPYRPPDGSLCAFWIGGWEPGGINRRTDLLPWRFDGDSEEPPPPEPGDLLTTEQLDQVFSELAKRLDP